MPEVVNMVVWLLLAEVNFYFVRKVQTYCMTLPAFYAMRTGGTFPEVKANKA
jgi:hypothetical protein